MASHASTSLRSILGVAASALFSGRSAASAWAMAACSGLKGTSNVIWAGAPARAARALAILASNSPHHIMKDHTRLLHVARAECLLQAGLTDDGLKRLGHVLASPKRNIPLGRAIFILPFVAVFRSIRTEENAVFLMLSGIPQALALPTGFEPVFQP